MSENKQGRLYNVGFSPKPTYVKDPVDEDKNRAVVQVRKITWPKLVKLAQKLHPLDNKHNAPYIVYGKFTRSPDAAPGLNGSVYYAFRENASIKQLEGLTLDLDDSPLSFEQLQKRLAKRRLKHILYSTYRYDPKDPDYDRRFRIIVPLDKPIAGEDLRPAGLGLAKALGLPPKSVDLSSLVISQPSYLRACKPGREDTAIFSASEKGREAPSERLIEVGRPFLDELGQSDTDSKRTAKKLIQDLKSGKIGVGDRHAAFGRFIADCKNKGWTFDDTILEVETLNAGLADPLPDEQVDGLSRFWSSFERNDNAFSYVELADKVAQLLEYASDKKKLTRKLDNVLKMIGNSVAEKTMYRKSVNGISTQEVEYLLTQIAQITQSRGDKTAWKAAIHTQKQRRIADHRRRREQKREAQQLDKEEEEIDFELIAEAGGTSPRFPLSMTTRLETAEKACFPDAVVSEDADGVQTVRLQVTLENFDHFLAAYNTSLQVDVFKKEGTARIDDEVIDNGREAYATVLSTVNRNDMKGWKETLPDFMATVGRRNPSNPVELWLDSLEYKGTGHIESLADCITVATEKEEKIKQRMIRRWMIQACAAANMCKDTLNIEAKPMYGYMLVLQGAQGTEKSKFFKSLLPLSIAEDYLRTGVRYDHNDKDSLAQAVGAWLCELEELDTTFTRTETGAMKQFLTREVDIWRAPYGKFSDKWKRCTVFWGSVNEQHFLRDSTGNRRFWPLTVHALILPDSPNSGVDLEAAWAEAWRAYLDGEQWWPTKKEERVFEEHRRTHYSGTTDTPLDEDLTYFFGTPEDIVKCKKRLGSRTMSVKQILEMVGYGHKALDKQTRRNLTQWLTANCVSITRQGHYYPDKLKANGAGSAFKWRVPYNDRVKHYLAIMHEEEGGVEHE